MPKIDFGMVVSVALGMVLFTVIVKMVLPMVGVSMFEEV